MTREAKPSSIPADHTIAGRTTEDRSRCTRGILPSVGRVLATLAEHPKARRSTLLLFAVIAYLLIGRMVDPGFNEYWWYQLGQTTVILAVMLILESLFLDEGGLAWQTHGIVLMTTYADVAGTANGFYDQFGPYDKIVHFSSGAAFAASTYEVLRLLDQRGTINYSAIRRVTVSLAISFAIAGVTWEIYEQLSDDMFNSGRVQSRVDTIVDLITDLGGGIVAVMVLHRRESNRQSIANQHAPHSTPHTAISRGR